MSASRRFLLGCSAVLLLLAAVMLWRARRPTPVVPNTSRSAAVHAAPPAVASVVPPVVETAPAAVTALPSAEIAATARMYAAHAPLRVPELADPDSTTNKQILQTMVAKALAQSAKPASGPAPTRP